MTETILEHIPKKRKYLSDSVRRKIYERDGGVCAICLSPTRFWDSLYDSPFNTGPRAGSVDHIIPVSKGGTNEESNLRWACRSCNCARGSKNGR